MASLAGEIIEKLGVSKQLDKFTINTCVAVYTMAVVNDL